MEEIYLDLTETVRKGMMKFVMKIEQEFKIENIISQIGKKLEEGIRKKNEFIEKARKKHGDRYEYFLVVYINTKKKVEIYCRNHGSFWMMPNSHIYNCQGCPKCSLIVYSTKEWIMKAIKVHGDKYDYSKVNYSKGKIKVEIICQYHGSFWQQPADHINSHSGCPKCYGNYSYSTEEWIMKAIKVHGDKYDYSKVNYQNNNKHIEIICRSHGSYWQPPNLHISQKQGCPKCQLKYISTENCVSEAIKVHGNKYDYSKTKYISTGTYIEIICSIHGSFWQIPDSHISKKHGCTKCTKMYNYTTNEWIVEARKIHGDKYNYDKVNYINNKTKVIITCYNHGNFEQGPKEHVYQKQGCPSCKNKTEGILYNFLKEHISCEEIKREATFNFCISNKGRYYRFDFYIEKYNLIVELDGLQHFKFVSNWRDPAITNQVDKYKANKVQENGYTIVRLLQEDVFHDRIDWKTLLIKQLKVHSRDNPQHIFIGNNELHQQAFTQSSFEDVHIILID